MTVFNLLAKHGEPKETYIKRAMLCRIFGIEYVFENGLRGGEIDE